MQGRNVLFLLLLSGWLGAHLNPLCAAHCIVPPESQRLIGRKAPARGVYSDPLFGTGGEEQQSGNAP